MNVPLLALVGLLTTLTLSACGGSDGNVGSGGAPGSDAGRSGNPGGAGAANSGGANSGGAVGTPSERALASCNAECTAAAAPTHCMVIGDPAGCAETCRSRVAALAAPCVDEFTAYYECLAAHPAECIGGNFKHAVDTCQAEVYWLGSCASTGGLVCAGSDANAHCPVIPCPCASGVRPVSGLDNIGSGCTCWTETTCQAACN